MSTELDDSQTAYDITLRTSELLGSDAHVINLEMASLVSLVLVTISGDIMVTRP